MSAKAEDEYDPLFEVESITNHRVNSKGKPMLKVKWASDGHSTWERLTTIK